MRFLASSTAIASAPSSSPGVSSWFTVSPLTSGMSSSSDSGTGGSSAGSRSSSRVPCSGARGLPLAGLTALVGLAALSPSLCPVAGAGVRGLVGSLAVAGSPGVSALTVALLSLSTCSARALACGSPRSRAHSKSCSKAEEEAK
eukprot:5269230-Amphidinium_carterae.1